MTEERSVGQLVADASREISELVRHEIALAKAEVKSDVVKGASAGGLFGAAGYLAFLSTILLAVAAAYGLAALGLPTWAAFLVLALLLLLLAGVLGVVGVTLLKKVRPPERTIRSAKLTIATVKGGSRATSAS